MDYNSHDAHHFFFGKLTYVLKEEEKGKGKKTSE
jgi:hypothetical protein